MILNSIDRVLILDDQKNEVKALKTMLVNNDIDVTFLTPNQAKKKRLRKNRQLLFFDLSLNDGDNISTNISTIRSILSKLLPAGFGAYGLIMWTSHFDEIKKLKDKIQEDGKNNKYPIPLFVLGLDKLEYIKKGNYNSLFDDLERLLSVNKAAYFFLNWSSSVYSGVNKAISDIYQLEPEYDKQESNLPYLLYLMAVNYTGIPEDQIDNYDLTLDAYKAFDKLLYSDSLIQTPPDNVKLFHKKMTNPWAGTDKSFDISADLNSKLLIESSNLSQSTIIPGSVYRVKHKRKNNMIVNKTDYKGDTIIIELTPPCDFSQNNKSFSRIIAGFIFDCPATKSGINKMKDKFRKERYYKVWPININGQKKFICFDFGTVTKASNQQLKNSASYELIFRVKAPLFADILQKFSSHASRLGLGIIQL